MLNLNKKKPVIVDPIERLQAESEEAIGVFVETKNKLAVASESILSEEAREEEKIKAKLEEIAQLEARKVKLAEMRSKNENYITKIDKILE
jgi:translation initiation factor 6 (eIF-6)